MTKVMLGGSRRITRLNADVRRRVDQMLNDGATILVGDANGADKAVQRYLHEKRYGSVEVFVSGGVPRNNLGGWLVREVMAPAQRSGRKDFRFYAMKDKALASEASWGLLLWDGESRGTIVNVLRLVSQEKRALVYLVHSKDFVTLSTLEDAWDLIDQCPVGVRDRVRREWKREDEDTRTRAGPEATQPVLL